MYQRIKTGKDLIADVVPPSAYIIEAFLEATIVARNRGPSNPVENASNVLRAAYEGAPRVLEPTGSWSGVLRTQLTKAAHEPAKSFWEVLEQSFLPAMDRGNADAAGDAYLQMAETFRAHRHAIDEVVKLTHQHNGKLERSAAVSEQATILRISEPHRFRLRFHPRLHGGRGPLGWWGNLSHARCHATD